MYNMYILLNTSNAGYVTMGTDVAAEPSNGLDVKIILV